MHFSILPLQNTSAGTMPREFCSAQLLFLCFRRNGNRIVCLCFTSSIVNFDLENKRLPHMHMLNQCHYYWSGAGLSSFICLIRYAFSSLNCSSSDRSVWNRVRKSTSLSWFRSRMSRIGFGLFGLATNT